MRIPDQRADCRSQHSIRREGRCYWKFPCSIAQPYLRCCIWMILGVSLHYCTSSCVCVFVFGSYDVFSILEVRFVHWTYTLLWLAAFKPWTTSCQQLKISDAHDWVATWTLANGHWCKNYLRRKIFLEPKTQSSILNLNPGHSHVTWLQNSIVYLYLGTYHGSRRYAATFCEYHLWNIELCSWFQFSGGYISQHFIHGWKKGRLCLKSLTRVFCEAEWI